MPAHTHFLSPASTRPACTCTGKAACPGYGSSQRCPPLVVLAMLAASTPVCPGATR